MTAESDPEAETAAEPTGNEEGAGTHWTITAEEESAGPPAPIYRVHLHHDGARLETIQLLPGELTIGRTRDNDLQIESRYISRRHCRLLLTASGLSVEDLGSTNGTFVNAVQARRQPVNSGDIVRIGMHELSVEVFVPQD